MLRLSRLAALTYKELQVVLLDRRTRFALLATPLLQLFLFGLATTLDVTNVSVGIVNRDSGIVSERLLSALDGSKNISTLVYFPDVSALHQGIERKRVIAGIVIPQDISARMVREEGGSIGLVLDGRRINSAQIVAGYIGQITQQVGLDLRSQSRPQRPVLSVTNWFNPNLENVWFTMPALIAMIVTVVALTVSAQSIAREREDGTIDQMLILPLSRFEILIGKIAPGFLIALFVAGMFVILIPLLFHVPLNGSLFLLWVAIFGYGLSVAGIGLAISAITQNQQQAFLAAFLVMVPLILSSGYVTPFDNMPQWLQFAARANPVYHMLIVCQGMFLKDLPAFVAWLNIWPMFLIAVATLSIALLVFKSRVD